MQIILNSPLTYSFSLASLYFDVISLSNSVVSIDELSLLNAGINTSSRIESKHKVKSPLLFEPNIMHLDSKTTIEDILNYKKTDIQSYLKSKGEK